MILTLKKDLYNYLNEEARKLVKDYVDNMSIDLVNGEYPIKDKEIFAKVLSYTTSVDNNQMLEAHNQYVDIQYVLSGKERIEVYNRSQLTSKAQYAPQTDCEFFIPDESCLTSTVHLSGEYCVVFFSNDAHLAALNFKETSREVKKLVIKIHEKYFS